MKILLNVLWFLLSGLWMALAYVFAGLLMAFTIIGMPFAIQSFKLAGFALWPFGRVVIPRPGADVALSTIGNFLWFILAGWWLALGHVFSGLLLFLTIIGIPFGVASFKLAGLSLVPFGKQIVNRESLPMLPPGSIVVTAPQLETTTVPAVRLPSLAPGGPGKRLSQGAPPSDDE